jgi:propanol-preferring alcohol dehydrogenase
MVPTRDELSPQTLAPQYTKLPLFPLVAREYTYFGSFWGNYNDLTEVLALAEAGQITHTVTRVRFDDVNEGREAIARRDMLGRAVIVYD